MLCIHCTRKLNKIRRISYRSLAIFKYFVHDRYKIRARSNDFDSMGRQEALGEDYMALLRNHSAAFDQMLAEWSAYETKILHDLMDYSDLWHQGIEDTENHHFQETKQGSAKLTADIQVNSLRWVCPKRTNKGEGPRIKKKSRIEKCFWSQQRGVNV